MSSPAMDAAVPVAFARGVDPGALFRPDWQRHTGGPAPLSAAVLLAMLIAGLPARWWSGQRGLGLGPAAGRRFARDSRAPPEGHPQPA